MFSTFSNKNQIKNHDFFIFELLIIELCNMNCSYCYMRNDSPSWGKFSPKQKCFDVINKLSEMDQKVSLCLSGGEASLHPNFMDMVELIAELIKDRKIYELHINTNLQLSKDKIKTITELQPNVKFHISYHYEADSEFLEKLLLLTPEQFELNIMIHPNKQHKQQFLDFIEQCKQHNILYNLKPVYIKDKFKPSSYVLDMMDNFGNKEYIDDNGVEYNDFDLYNQNLLPMNTLGWDCYYIFYTIDCRQGNIKQMCKIHDNINIFDDFEIFNNYDLSKPIKCPFENKCLWASSLDHYKKRPDELS